MEDLLIVKVGTGVLTKDKNGICSLGDESFKRIGEQVRQLSDAGMSVMLVSSGAITAGITNDGQQREKITDMAELQRYAARGWSEVLRRWKMAIGTEKISSALLTKHEIHDFNTNRKMLDFMTSCFRHGDVVLVNENDAICDDEIRFGDNDTLAAALAVEFAKTRLFNKIQLVLLTNKNGLNRVANDDSTLIKKVTSIASVEEFACQSASCHSRGGMITKVRAAKIAGQAGVETFIANGSAEQAITRTLNGEIGTRFVFIAKHG